MILGQRVQTCTASQKAAEDVKGHRIQDRKDNRNRWRTVSRMLEWSKPNSQSRVSRKKGVLGGWQSPGERLMR